MDLYQTANLESKSLQKLKALEEELRQETSREIILIAYDHDKQAEKNVEQNEIR